LVKQVAVLHYSAHKKHCHQQQQQQHIQCDERAGGFNQSTLVQVLSRSKGSSTHIVSSFVVWLSQAG
jgi:hypothetical protein